MSDSNLPRIIAVVNQKGGVGKTTTTINLAAALCEQGAKVLVVDMDPQGNASTGLGSDSNSRLKTTYDLIVEECRPNEVISATSIDGLFLCPANGDLASADIDLVSNEKRSFLLHDAVRHPQIVEMRFDFVLVDCPPSLNLLTVNALVASHSVLVPLQTEFFALEGLSQLLTSIREVRLSANPGLRIEGVLLTMHDSRNKLSQQVEADARENLGDLVFKTVIPRNVRLSEAPSFGKSVLQYDSTSKGADAYRSAAKELVSRHPIKHSTNSQ